MNIIKHLFYFQALESIRLDIEFFPVWIAIDETTDAEGRYIANLLVGALKKHTSSKAHLLMSRKLEFTNNTTITQQVLDAFSKRLFLKFFIL